MTHAYFGQGDWRCRFEWGRRGALNAADRGDVLVVVDTLSFSTAVVTAVARGVRVHACRHGDDPRTRAAELRAEYTVKRRLVPAEGRYSLSPASLETLDPGSRLVVASLNGATCVTLGKRVPRLFVASLVNAGAVARAVNELLHRTDLHLTVLACGERWDDDDEDGGIRVAVEDQLGAGAVLAGIDAPMSPEARVCRVGFEAVRESGELEAVLRDCGSGRELVDWGFGHDVEHAATLDRYDCAPVLEGDWFESA